MSAPSQPCHTLWTGDRLGPLATACLASFVRQGHEVVLHAYHPLPDVPAGVRVSDAALVLPESAMVRHRPTGSTALFSNRFRYRLFSAGAGYWIDTDLYCVRPLDFTETAVFGLETASRINGAVLRLADDDPILTEMEALFTARAPIPRWHLPRRRQWKLRVLDLIGRPVALGDLPWGITGPKALTHLIREQHRWHEARPVPVFYPLGVREAGRIFDATFDVGELLTPETRTIHLWNSVVARRPLSDAQPGSFLDRLLKGTLPY